MYCTLTSTSTESLQMERTELRTSKPPPHNIPPLDPDLYLGPQEIAHDLRYQPQNMSEFTHNSLQWALPWPTPHTCTKFCCNLSSSSCVIFLTNTQMNPHTNGQG